MKIRDQYRSALRPARLFGLVLLMVTQSIFAQSSSTSLASSNRLPIPESHQLVRSRLVTQDEVPATLVRYERSDRRNSGIGGEHFSVLTSKDGKLLGFVNISLDLSGKSLPSRELAERITREYLLSSAPDLLPNMRITSIAPYEKPLRIWATGETISVNGMRVKARNLADGSWFWVVVGSDGRPMSFERDVGWSSLLFQRSSEYWLHDPWVEARG